MPNKKNPDTPSAPASNKRDTASAISNNGKSGGTPPPAPAAKDVPASDVAQQVRELAKLLEETGLTEIEITTGAHKVRVARNISVVGSAPAVAAAAPAAPQPTADAPMPMPQVEEDLSQHPGAVKSPMVGTIYTAPEPGAKPFVTEGAKVKAGEVLFIVEAMKTMNNIAAPASGTIKRICVENSQPIEYDEVLAIIE